MTDLGFLEEAPQWRLTSQFFPSKAAGSPAWLDYKNVPGELKCSSCSSQLSFLLQIYAPFEEVDRAFHRTVTVLACLPCMKKQSPAAVKVLRCQLPRVNHLYPSTPPDEESEPNNLPDFNCPHACSQCNIPHVVEKKSGCPIILRRAFDIVTEPESLSKKPEKPVEIKTSITEMSNDEVAALEKDMSENEKIDHVFLAFRNRVAHDWTQVLRYQRNGSPLPISSGLDSSSVPKCSCGLGRKFEFQVMPGLIHELGLFGEQPSLPDFGTIVVFTCPGTCVGSESYHEEHAIVQYID